LDDKNQTTIKYLVQKNNNSPKTTEFTLVIECIDQSPRVLYI